VKRPGADAGFQLAAGAFGYNSAVIDNSDTAGEFVSFIQILSRQEYRYAISNQRPDNIPYLGPVPGIKSGGWLVEKEEIGRDHETGGYIDAAAHAAGISLHLAIGSVGQLKEFKKVSGAVFRFRPRVAAQAAKQHEIFAPGKVLIYRSELAGKADSPAHFIGFLYYIITQHAGRAAIRAQQCGQHTDKCGLAGTVRAEKPVDGPGRYE
jgi:hypothetical protein